MLTLEVQLLELYFFYFLLRYISGIIKLTTSNIFRRDI